MTTISQSDIDQAKEAAIQRLRKSSEEHSERMKAAGLQAGRIWAMNAADAACLKALSSAYDESEALLDGWEQYAGSPGEALYSMMFNRGSYRSDCYAKSKQFWSGDEDHPEDEEWVDAFATGSFLFWVEVKDQL